MGSDQPQDDEPRSIQGLVERIVRERNALHELLGRYREEDLSRPGPEGWAAKDHVVHLAVWLDGVTALLKRTSRQAAMGVPDEVWQRHDVAITNEIIFQRFQHLTWDQALDKLHQSEGALLGVLVSMSWDDLQRPYRDYAPDATTSQFPVAQTVAGNTWQHYPEHSAWIRDLLAANGAVPTTA